MTDDEKLVEAMARGMAEYFPNYLGAEEFMEHARAALRAIDASGTHLVVPLSTLEAASETITAFTDGRNRAEKRIAELEARITKLEIQLTNTEANLQAQCSDYSRLFADKVKLDARVVDLENTLRVIQDYLRTGKWEQPDGVDNVISAALRKK